jgi:hypothetical protein
MGRGGEIKFIDRRDPESTSKPIKRGRDALREMGGPRDTRGGGGVDSTETKCSV